MIFLTDGMLERNAASSEIPQLVTAGAAMHPREAVQHLVQAVLEATDGELNDDATVMCLDWHGGRPRERTTDSGANDETRSSRAPLLAGEEAVKVEARDSRSHGDPALYVRLEFLALPATDRATDAGRGLPGVTARVGTGASVELAFDRARSGRRARAQGEAPASRQRSCLGAPVRASARC